MVSNFVKSEDHGAKITKHLESESEIRARAILEQTTTRLKDRYQVGLLWKHDFIQLPNSYPMALRRLECLERRMKRDPELRQNIQQQIVDYQQKGYAHRATEKEIRSADPGRIWYLPLGVVISPKKPGKIRLVWDAKINGISLNSVLLPGPDLLTPLQSVLFRFRQFPVAVSSDIKEMFHQIRINDQDRHSQRFLWRDNVESRPEIYIMDVATFGATCSPTTAQFIKNINAERFAEQCPRAVEAILKSHYVDDFLDSFETEDQAKSVSDDVRRIHGTAGFDIRNWASNSEEVLTHLGEKINMHAKCLTASKESGTERVLGLLWHPSLDELSFSTVFQKEITELLQSRARPTKRQILKCIMSLFDPLGLLACLSVHGKILLQNVWRTGTQWDEPVTDEIFKGWREWSALLQQVNKIKIPRCYFPSASNSVYESLQVHVFVDASEVAYSAAVFFRIINPQGAIECTLVAAKTKVAPLKHVSIPRLELRAAVLGASLLSVVVESHTISIRQRFLWSDSNTVLAWIRSDHRKYRQFVACRVGEILETTNEKEWRWVPSKLNVADEATKWGNGPCFDASHRWFIGPDFLYKPENEWPKPIQSIQHTEEELRHCLLHQETASTGVVDFFRFSKWNRLLRTMAYVVRAIGRMGKVGFAENGFRSESLTHDELHRAEKMIWKLVQKETYPDEIILLSRYNESSKKGQLKLSKASPLYTLTPLLDEHGVLRIDGRISAVKSVPTDVKFPIILPKNHPVTNLLIDDFHRKFRHGNSETVFNEMRQLFYIPRLRVLIRKVSSQCQLCKLLKARPAVPRMAPLPAARLSPLVRPFSYVGLDYFGPILVKVGRSNAKRWIALFTCLTIRAIHVEVAYDLSTQACISCIRRFVGRRGAPLEIYSDNGRNFVGSNRVLMEQMKRTTEEMTATFTNARTKWIFIPPSAPHMGGSWERMVRSIKAAMINLPQDRRLNDEGLQTMVIEAEAIVNSRPLTYLPLDSAEQEALTPNHFLLGSSNGVKQPAVLINTTRTALRSWDLIQRNLDHFWKRWLREYLPTLTKRTKWFQEVKPVTPGDIVVVIDETKRNGWIRGRVLEATAGEDGRVRQAIVQTSTGLLRRPVSKIAVLDVVRADHVDEVDQPYGRGIVGTQLPQPGNPARRNETYSGNSRSGET